MAMSDDMKAAVDSLADPTDHSVFTCSNGLKLKLRRVSQMIVADAARRLVAPKVPRVYDEDKQREFDNPGDPAYQQELRQHNYDSAMLAYNVYYIMGTTPIEPLPSDVIPLDNDEWIDMIEATGVDLDIPRSGPRRKLAWLKYHAVPSEDMTEVMFAISRYSGGTLEQDVKTAMDSFRSDPSRAQALGIDSATEDRLRNWDRTSGGNGTEPGGEGGGGVRALPVESMDTPAF